MGEDAGEHAGKGVARGAAAGRAAGIGLRVRADRADHGGEADLVGVNTRQRGGPGGQRRDHVVDQQEPQASWRARVADGPRRTRLAPRSVSFK